MPGTANVCIVGSALGICRFSLGLVGLRLPGAKLFALLGLDWQPNIVLHSQMSSIRLPGAERLGTVITLEVPNVLVNQDVFLQRPLFPKSSATAVLRTQMLKAKVLFGVEVLRVWSVVMPDQVANNFEASTAHLTPMGQLRISLPVIANVVLHNVSFVAEALVANLARHPLVLAGREVVQTQFDGQLFEFVVRDGSIRPQPQPRLVFLSATYLLVASNVLLTTEPTATLMAQERLHVTSFVESFVLPQSFLPRKTFPTLATYKTLPVFVYFVNVSSHLGPFLEQFTAILEQRNK